MNYDIPESIKTKPCMCKTPVLVGIRTVDGRWLKITTYNGQASYSFPPWGGPHQAQTWLTMKLAQDYLDKNRGPIEVAAKAISNDDCRVHAINLPDSERERRKRADCKCNIKISSVDQEGDSCVNYPQHVFEEAMDFAHSAYEVLVAAGIPKDDAAKILPRGMNVE